jgi:hypothetical protein
VRSLQFNLTRDQKWEAVMAGFVASVPELALSGILTGDRLVGAQALVKEYEAALRQTETGKVGDLTKLVEGMLSKNGLL